MTLRAAVVGELRRGETAAGDRVYQAFLAPDATAPPYIAVKMAGRIGGERGTQPVECYLYASLTSFSILDALEADVIRLLHRREFSHPPTGLHYRLTYASSAGGTADAERKLIGRVVTFDAAHAVVV